MVRSGGQHSKHVSRRGGHTVSGGPWRRLTWEWGHNRYLLREVDIIVILRCTVRGIPFVPRSLSRRVGAQVSSHGIPKCGR